VKRGADIIGFDVEVVVPAKHGAYPTSCYPDYFLDGKVFVEYIKACQEDRFDSFLGALCERGNREI